MNMLDFLIRLKSVRKGGAGLPPREMRDPLMSEHLGPAMHAKLRQVSRARKKRSL
jgi:hypothetical protein